MNKKIIGLLTVGGLATLALATAATTPVSASTTNDVYRLYNHNTGEHFYTTSVTERNVNVSAGWNYEGTGWVAPSSSKSPVYRVYNPNAKGGDHYYTKSKYEAQSLVDLGWRWDNNGKAVFYSGGNTPVKVAYNPNAQSGAHNYTTSNFEQNSLLNGGWKFGATAFDAIAPGKTIAPPPSTGTESAPRQVDVNITGVGGTEQSVTGSYRYLYANKAFGSSPTGIPSIQVDADVAMVGSSDNAELQFVLAGTTLGQIGVELHNNGSGVNQLPYWKTGINAATINFPATAGTSGQQFYSSASSVPVIAQGQKVHVTIKYYESTGIMQTYLNGSLIGQYASKLTGVASAQYILHTTATKSSSSVSNLSVQRYGKVVGPANGTTIAGVQPGNPGVLYK